MNSEYEKMPIQQNHPPKWKDAFSQTMRGTTHNWGWKILSVLLAIGLWAGLISQDPTLTREKSFQDTEISITGADTLKRNGFIVVSSLTDLPYVRLKADVPQKEYNDVTASTYNPRLDLSRIRTAGTIEVPITSTSTTTYGTVTDVSPASVEVTVEEYITRYRIPVTIDYQGEYAEGVYSNTPTLDPPTIAVSGPASLVNQVSRAVAYFDPSTLPDKTGIVSTSVPFDLIGKDGNPIQSDLIQVTSESVIMDNVILEQTLYPTRTVSLSQVGLTVNAPPEGYQVNSITVTPGGLVIAAEDETILEELDFVYLEGAVDLSGHTESFTEVVRIRKPSVVKSMSCDSVTVAIEIKPIVSAKDYTNLRISVDGQDANISSSLEVKRSDVILEGPQLWINSLKTADITLYVDLSGLTTPGIYTLPIRCRVEDTQGGTFTFTCNPASVQVTLTAK